jgi:hypothetical protein
MRPIKKRFVSFVTAGDATATQLKASIRPKTLSDLSAAIRQIMDGSVEYVLDDTLDPRSNAQCFCLIDHLAIYFNEHPTDTFELIDAEFQP